jgi:hypothetical protein
MAHLAKDAPGIFVHKVMKRLSGLYQQMDGKDADYVNEGAFGREIRACVECFFRETTRHNWVYRPNIQDNDDMVMQLIKTRVYGHLENAARMSAQTTVMPYKIEIMMEFDDIWRYVREWLREGEPDTRGGEQGERMQEMLDELQTLLEHWRTRAA